MKITLRNKNFILPIVVLIVWSCQNKSDTEGKSNIDFVNVKTEAERSQLSDFAETVETIKLETTPESLIRNILTLSHSENILFVYDGIEVFKFNRSGEFLDKIGKIGEGPGELETIVSFAVDWPRERIYLNSFFKIVEYDFEGEFIKEQKQTIWIDRLEIIDNQLSAFITERGLPSNEEGTNFTEVSLITFDDDLNVVNKTPVRRFKTLAGTASVMGRDRSYLSSVENDHFIFYPVYNEVETIHRDTLYQISEGQLIPKMKVRFDVEYNSTNKLKLTSFLRTNSYCIINYGKDLRANQAIIDLAGTTFYRGDKGFTDDLFNTGKVFLKPWNLKNDEFYFVKDAYELAAVMDGVTEDDNPVLFILKVNK